jgi:RimK-like ATPgrasp N-terminal domain
VAAARGHKWILSVMMTQDLRSPAVVRVASEELEELIQRSVASVTEHRLSLNLFLGQPASHNHERRGSALFWKFNEPSDPSAVDRFAVATDRLGIGTEVIGRADYGRLHDPADGTAQRQ